MIREIDFEHEKHELLEVIRKSFLTVANDFNLTRENAPTNPAFLTLEKLEESVLNNLEFFVKTDDRKIAGCVGIQPGKNQGEYYIERLAVLPAYRHRKIGSDLLQFSFRKMREKKGSVVSIGIVNENTVLKDWYLKHGFVETGTRKFDHLPFTVCFMSMSL